MTIRFQNNLPFLWLLVCLFHGVSTKTSRKLHLKQFCPGLDHLPYDIDETNINVAEGQPLTLRPAVEISQLIVPSKPSWLLNCGLIVRACTSSHLRDGWKVDNQTCVISNPSATRNDTGAYIFLYTRKNFMKVFHVIVDPVSRPFLKPTQNVNRHLSKTTKPTAPASASPRLVNVADIIGGSVGTPLCLLVLVVLVAVLWKWKRKVFGRCRRSRQGSDENSGETGVQLLSHGNRGNNNGVQTEAALLEN